MAHGTSLSHHLSPGKDNSAMDTWTRAFCISLKPSPSSTKLCVIPPPPASTKLWSSHPLQHPRSSVLSHHLQHPQSSGHPTLSSIHEALCYPTTSSIHKALVIPPSPASTKLCVIPPPPASTKLWSSHPLQHPQSSVSCQSSLLILLDYKSTTCSMDDVKHVCSSCTVCAKLKPNV